MDSITIKTCLSQEQIQTLEKQCQINFYTKEVTSDYLIAYVPMEYPVDGDDCRFVLTSNEDGGFTVSYDRPSDMYTCLSFTSKFLCDVLYETILETCSV